MPEFSQEELQVLLHALREKIRNTTWNVSDQSEWEYLVLAKALEDKLYNAIID